MSHVSREDEGKTRARLYYWRKLTTYGFIEISIRSPKSPSNNRVDTGSLRGLGAAGGPHERCAMEKSDLPSGVE